MIMVLSDVQSDNPDIQINLTRVGVTDVKKLVEVARSNKRPIVLISSFDIFVDLPANIKGANLSRNFEAIDEVLEEAIESPVYEIEELCSEVVKRLLDRHEYASDAEVWMKSEYVIKRKTPVSKMHCQEVVDIFAEARAKRNGSVRKMIGAEVTGITTCPCAQQIMQDRATEELKKLGANSDLIENFLKSVPMATHNQRGRGYISIDVQDGYEVSLDRIIKVIHESMSSETFELLKRMDEAYVVENAHRNPAFVEDCVRIMAKKMVTDFEDLPDEAVITIKQINEESIHKHNAFAERIAKMGDLRKEIQKT
ncbi:MAG: GTP cyclohydrolase MptA [Halobacteriota archaeon]|nr:GTP cyclohydrolase MptA [Halobacteriota archaeon]